MMTVSKVAIGCSAGGVNALVELLGNISKECSSSFFVVLHLAGDRASRLSKILTDRIGLKVLPASNGLAVRPSTVYVAQSNHHLVVEDDRILCPIGPRENRFRPSIDVLFRSLATAYGTQAIGVLLSGMLNDGVAGLGAISRSGGVTMVQDPDEAKVKDLPQAALDAMDVHHTADLREIGELIEHYSVTQAPPPQPHAEFDLLEQALSTGRLSLSALSGEPTAQSCPECGGQLRKLKDPVVDRYRCYDGHSFTEICLSASRDQHIENCLWSAYRSLQDKAAAGEMLLTNAQANDRKFMVKHGLASLREIERKVELLEEILQIPDRSKPIGTKLPPDGATPLN